MKYFFAIFIVCLALPNQIPLLGFLEASPLEFKEIDRFTTSSIPTAPTVPMPITCPQTGIHHIPAPNCQEFIVCINGSQHPGRCSDGYLWDAGRSGCVQQDQVDCGSRIRP